MLIDLLLPRRCVSCGRSGGPVCRACLDGLPRVGASHCSRCGGPTAVPMLRCRDCARTSPAYATARSALLYEGVTRLVVSAWKERGVRTLANQLAAIIGADIPARGGATVTWVPPDLSRQLRRGHHPARALARELAAQWGTPGGDLLIRTRPARRQARLARAERYTNVCGAFESRGPCEGEIVLVDDVFTTGATVDECARALRRAGATRVDVVTLARAPR